MIYPIDSAIHSLNNWGQGLKENYLFYSRNKIFPKLKLWEFFCVDVEKTVEQFRHALLKAKRPESNSSTHDGPPLEVHATKSYQRFSARIDMEKAVEKFNTER